MRNPLSRSNELLLILLAIVLLAGCGEATPTSAVPSPSPSPLDTSILPTPSHSTSILPTPRIDTVQGRILFLYSPSIAPQQATLEIGNPDGSERQSLAEAVADPDSAAVSPNKQYVAFFTAEAASDGVLTVWDVQESETIFETPVPAETSGSFRDASAMRYLAWSPDSENLAVVMGRDLHSFDISDRRLQMLVPHREEQYALAGVVLGSIKRPVWSTDGGTLVFDAWSPPDVLSESADDIRDVHYVEVSTGVTGLLLEDAQVAHHTVSGGQELALERNDGSLVLLDLTTLETQEAEPAPGLVGQMLCDPQGRRCASIVSEQAEGDLLRLVALDEGSQMDNVHIADMGDLAAGCRFQSVLWSPDGDVLLATAGCDGRVSLWSVHVSDLEATHLIDWAGADSVFLLSWFE